MGSVWGGGGGFISNTLSAHPQPGPPGPRALHRRLPALPAERNLLADAPRHCRVSHSSNQACAHIDPLKNAQHTQLTAHIRATRLGGRRGPARPRARAGGAPTMPATHCSGRRRRGGGRGRARGGHSPCAGCLCDSVERPRGGVHSAPARRSVVLPLAPGWESGLSPRVWREAAWLSAWMGPARPRHGSSPPRRLGPKIASGARLSCTPQRTKCKTNHTARGRLAKHMRGYPWRRWRACLWPKQDPLWVAARAISWSQVTRCNWRGPPRRRQAPPRPRLLNDCQLRIDLCGRVWWAMIAWSAGARGAR